MSKNYDKIQNEKEFHNKRYQDDQRVVVHKYYEINDIIENKYESLILDKPNDKKFLELGCGVNSLAPKLLKCEADYSAIDISEQAIQIVKNMIKSLETKYDANLDVMDAENLSYPEQYFDVIFGKSILHHLDLDKSISSISKCLKKNGKSVFIEPLGINPIINKFRNKTQNLRTVDEHPLIKSDFAAFEKYFSNIKVHNYFLFTIAAIPFRNTFLFKYIKNFFYFIDKLLFKLPYVKWLSWQVVIELSEPKHNIN